MVPLTNFNWVGLTPTATIPVMSLGKHGALVAPHPWQFPGRVLPLHEVDALPTELPGSEFFAIYVDI